MEYRLRNDLIRRDEEIVQFYYKSIGLIIKKRRLELDITQEALAKGICSNTYISKIENNQIEINKDNLLLIMERMEIPLESISFPDEMVEYLEKSLEYFFYKDIQKYEELFNKIKKYEFGILISIVRMGYYVLKEEYKLAKKINDEMYLYLNSLEDFGFSALLIFSCYYNIGIGDYKRAKIVIESINETNQKNELIQGLCTYAKFLINGHIHLFNKSRDAMNSSLHTFFHFENLNRINDLLIWKNIFAIYEGIKPKIPHIKYKLDLLLPFEKNFYLLIQIIYSGNPQKYIGLFDKNNWIYQAGCYFLASYYYSQNNEKYKDIVKEINDNHYTNESPIDFVNMLKLQEQNLEIQFKDYLVSIVLPYVYKVQNIFFMNLVTDKISEILSNNKRYKDSLTYIKKNENRLKLIQNYNLN